MSELTLETLARRVEALEQAARGRSDRPKDWRRVAGMFTDVEFSREVDAAGQAIRDAEREEAKQQESKE